jgi:hypothetical protein
MPSSPYTWWQIESAEELVERIAELADGYAGRPFFSRSR